MPQSVCVEERERYPPLHSEQQSMIENSLFYDSMVHRINPRSNGSGSRGNTGNGNPASAAISQHGNLGSRMNPEVTPREATECIGQGLLSGKNDR